MQTPEKIPSASTPSPLERFFKEHKGKILLFFGALLSGYVAINVAGVIYIINGWDSGSFWSRLGQFGDQFGFINSLISATTLFVVYLTYINQHAENETQKQERLAEIAKSEKERRLEQRERHSFALIEDFESAYQRATQPPLQQGYSAPLVALSSEIRSYFSTNHHSKDPEKAEIFIVNDLPKFLGKFFAGRSAETEVVTVMQKFFVAYDYLKEINQYDDHRLYYRMLFSSIRPSHILTFATYHMHVNGLAGQTGALDLLNLYSLSRTRPEEKKSTLLAHYLTIEPEPS